MYQLANRCKIKTITDTWAYFLTQKIETFSSMEISSVPIYMYVYRYKMYVCIYT